MDIENFMEEMDKESPQWFIELASMGDLMAYARHTFSKGISMEENKYRLRRNTGHRLFICARATHNGLRKEEEK